MFDTFIYFVVIIVGLTLLIPGCVMLLYGLYSLTIVGFDRSVRFFSFTGGFILITIFCVGYFFYTRDENDKPFIGKYETQTKKRFQLELRPLGYFKADKELFRMSYGKWLVVDFDNYHFIELYDKDANLIDQLPIKIKDDKIELLSLNSKIEDRDTLVFLKKKFAQ